MTVSQVGIAVSAVVIVVLAVLLVRLSRQVAALSKQVFGLEQRSNREPAVPTLEPHPARAPVTSLQATTPPNRQRSDDVAVITAMDETATADDLTTARIASVTLGGPLIKVAAFSHGVRQALREENRMRVAYVVRKELRRQRKIRRRRRAEHGSSQRWTS